MGKAVLNFLDSPVTFYGMRVTHLVVLLCFMVLCVYLDSLLAVLAIVGLALGVRLYFKKRPKFFLRRLFYQKLPTAAFFGKVACNLLETHIKRWVK